MKKSDFLSAIRERLGTLPERDIARSLEFYSEMIDDRIEDGMTEEEAVAEMGSPDCIAQQILMDTPLPKLVKAKVRPSRELHAWEIVLIILGFPVWFPLICAAFSVFLSVYIVIWAVVITVWSVAIAFAVSSVALIAGSAFPALTGNAHQSVLFIGAGLIFIGLAILMFFASKLSTVGMFGLSKLIIRGIKSIFIKKGEAR